MNALRALCWCWLSLGAAGLPEGLRFIPGPVNGLQIGESAVVYGDADGKLKDVRQVLFIGARRDVIWAGVPLVRRGAAAVAPEAERELFEQPRLFWSEFESKRFHDYAQGTTKVPIEAVNVSRYVRDGDTLEINGFRVDVVGTPGYTPGGVSYVIHAGGRKIACTGDLIHGDGRILDLYSLQDAIPEAKARGYHGYAARAGEVIASLRKIAALQPEAIVPARGPIIEDPPAAIGRLIARLEAMMRSHFSTDALRWYWGDENLRLRSHRVLPEGLSDVLPMAEQRNLPEWILAIGNSRLIVSRTGAAFLVDAGYRNILAELKKLQDAGRFRTLDGIWITHYHDDHTDYAQAVADAFRCPVYFAAGMRDILEHPARYRLPCLTTNPIGGAVEQRDGSKMRWHEFEFEFHRFPGQTLYHGGLAVRPAGGEPVFFAGDSFTPSGMDDYCLQNRNFLGETGGFLECLRTVEQRATDHWLINQHVLPMFRFTTGQIQRMKAELGKRHAILRELTPWPGPDYAVDESWARLYPYGSEAKAGETIVVNLKILNHSPHAETFEIAWNLPAGLKLIRAARRISLARGREGSARAEFKALTPGLHILTADVAFGGFHLREWTEAMVRVR